MKGLRFNSLLFTVYCLLFTVYGCGYTTKSLLPSYIKTVYVENFKNSIDITAEVSNKKPYSLYKPGLETEITKAIIDRFIYDGNLKVVKNRDEADAILNGELIEYVKEPLRYDTNDNVIEYKVRVVVSAQFLDKRENKVIWQAASFSGEASQRTQGSLEKSEETAKDEAIADVARRILEKTIEVW
ncbi:MAG: LPS assembly lipoprotein LptE [Candidatus Omnitrophica bacterium]|nr:LPS assembly lipoprotein LptE [Candidatus Omnitrophota bacterium]